LHKTVGFEEADAQSTTARVQRSRSNSLMTGAVGWVGYRRTREHQDYGTARGRQFDGEDAAQ
jgi:hypothetical protein